MILTGEKIRVWLATRPVDFRNYVERAVMPSRQRCFAKYVNPTTG